MIQRRVDGLLRILKVFSPERAHPPETWVGRFGSRPRAPRGAWGWGHHGWVYLVALLALGGVGCSSDDEDGRAGDPSGDASTLADAQMPGPGADGGAGRDGGPGGADGGPGGADGGLDGGPSADGGAGADAGIGADGASPLRPDNRTRDTDCDGLSDQEEFATIYPGGLSTDPSVADSDGDGLPDGLEVGRTQAVAGTACVPVLDLDPASRTSPVLADTDGDGLADGLEDANRNGRVDTGETSPLATDTDGDGLADGLEDANRNGVVDSGETDPVSDDTDADGVADGVEDRNRNGARDPGEMDPTRADTDAERLLDGAEDANLNGLRERFETDATTPDTDCDGLDDFAELNRTPPTSPVNADTDGDLIPDGVEVGVTGPVPGSSCPALVIDADPSTRTSPTDPDSDGDGLSDGDEDANRDGRVDPMTETDPNRADTDGDMVNDGDERRAGFDPLDPAEPGPGRAIGINAICSDANLRVVDFDIEPGRWTLANEQSTAYLRINVNAPGSNVAVAALDDSASEVAGFVLEMPVLPGPGDLPAQVSALESRIQGGLAAEGLTYASRASPRNITSHDSFPTAVSGFVDIGVSTNRNAAAVRNAMLRLTTGLAASAFPGLPTATGSGTREYVYGFQVLLRSQPARLIVVGALLARSDFDALANPRSFRLTDLVNGTALAEADARRDKDCDPLAASGVPVVDFVWMADVSGSTDDDRGRISSAAQLIFDELDRNNVSFRMGVVPHHQNRYRFGVGNGGNLRGSGFTRDRAQFVRDLEDTSGNDGCEFGLTAASDAIQRALPRSPSGTENARRFRSDATIAVVYISDEFADELQEPRCAPSGSTPPPTLPCRTGITDFYAGNVDTVCAAVPNQGCVDQVVQPFITELRNLNALAFAQVIAPNATPTTCEGYGCGVQSVNEPGRGYVEVVNATAGVIYSPCVANPGNALRAIIDAVTGAASPFRLSGNPISSTLRVGVVRGTSVVSVPRDRLDGFDYDAASNAIFFRGPTYRPQAGELVVVSYRLWEEPRPPCPPNQVFDSTLGICVCDGLVCQQCSANQVCDSDCNCACTANCNGNCGVGETCNTSTCQCECLSDCGGCPAGYACNQSTCQCECQDCGGACAATNQVCIAASCACECPENCGRSCPGNSACNDSLCDCVCPVDCDDRCPGLAECDDASTDCACICRDCRGACTGAATCNATACACECPPDCDEGCPGNLTCNPSNGCACECAPNCGGRCAANQRCDETRCECVPRF